MDKVKKMKTNTLINVVYCCIAIILAFILVLATPPLARWSTFWVSLGLFAVLAIVGNLIAMVVALIRKKQDFLVSSVKLMLYSLLICIVSFILAFMALSRELNGTYETSYETYAGKTKLKLVVDGHKANYIASLFGVDIVANGTLTRDKEDALQGTLKLEGDSDTAKYRLSKSQKGLELEFTNLGQVLKFKKVSNNKTLKKSTLASSSTGNANSTASSQSASYSSSSSQEEKVYKVGEPILFRNEALITITNVEWSDERNQFADSQPDKVLKVTYNVTNLSDSDYIVGSELTFYVGGNKMEDYPNGETFETISKGRQFEGAVAYFEANGTGDLELEVKPTLTIGVDPAIVKLDL